MPDVVYVTKKMSEAVQDNRQESLLILLETEKQIRLAGDVSGRRRRNSQVILDSG